MPAQTLSSNAPAQRGVGRGGKVRLDSTEHTGMHRQVNLTFPT